MPRPPEPSELSENLKIETKIDPNISKNHLHASKVTLKRWTTSRGSAGHQPILRAGKNGWGKGQKANIFNVGDAANYRLPKCSKIDLQTIFQDDFYIIPSQKTVPRPAEPLELSENLKIEAKSTQIFPKIICMLRKSH